MRLTLLQKETKGLDNLSFARFSFAPKLLWRLVPPRPGRGRIQTAISHSSKMDAGFRLLYSVLPPFCRNLRRRAGWQGPVLVYEVCQTGQTRNDRYCKILRQPNLSRKGSAVSISCPSCSSKRIHWSRRKGFLESGLFTMLFVRPFRCDQCDLRFFRLSFSANPEGSQPTTTGLRLGGGR
jgi:hypothetical protein